MLVFCSPVCTPNFTRPTLAKPSGAERGSGSGVEAGAGTKCGRRNDQK